MKLARMAATTNGLRAALIGGLLLAAAPVYGQLFEWRLKAEWGPDQYRHAMVYDEARAEVFLFGSNGGFSGQTWVWNGVNWTQRIVSGPAARDDHAMAYDQGRGVTVLFGGFDINSDRLSETWEWDGSSWTQRTVSGPTARRGHDMAYDTARGVTVLFGGDYLSDTWEWDGSGWTHRNISGPSGRMRHAMVYDEGRGVTVLFGGLGQGATVYGDTWEWDGTAWTQRVGSGPGPRYGHAMAYDTVRGVVRLYGGMGASDRYGDTWDWNGSAWTPRVVNSPGTISDHAMTFDRARQTTVLHGGSGASPQGTETWELVDCSSPVSISAHPAGVALLPNTTATFAVGVEGPATSFRWRRNQVDLADGGRVSGAAGAQLEISAVQASDEGQYDCVVRNSCNEVFSNSATLSCDPIILVHPSGEHLLTPGLQLSVSVPANAPYSYRWRQDGQNLFNIPGVFNGVTTNTLTLLSEDPSLEGLYDVRVTDSCGNVTSQRAEVRRCFPDVNCDGAENGFDIEAMEQAVNGDTSEFCRGDPDFNRDGTVNGFDVEAVELGVLGWPCP